MRYSYRVETFYPDVRHEYLDSIVHDYFRRCGKCNKNVDKDKSVYYISLTRYEANSWSSFNICKGCASTEKKAKEISRILYSISRL